MNDRVLVTGAGGFIGSHLVEKLVENGKNVRALVRYNARGDSGALEWVPSSVRSSIEIVRGDITDPYFVQSIVHGCSTVFHLAALISIPYSYEAPRVVFETNVMGTMNVAQACRSTGAALVHTSTSEVYGTAQTVPISEQHPLVGQSPYAASKIAADQCVLSFRRSFGVRSVTVRPFNTYGPRQSARAIIPAIITQALSGGVVRLGSLHPTRDLNFVEDTVRGFLCAAEAVDRTEGGPFNLGTGKEVSIGELARMLFDVLGLPVRIEEDPQRVRPTQSEVERLVADASKAREQLRWQPSVSLKEGLQRTADFLRVHLDRYKPAEYLR